jgi:RNA polymerase sigma-70 factor (ECF subfamily)
VCERSELNRRDRDFVAVADSEADACDRLQSGIERCLRTPPRDESRRVAGTMKIIGNLWRDEWRRRQVLRFEPLDEAPTLLDVELASLESIMIDRGALDDRWRERTDVEREIRFLWAVEDGSVAGVAERLGRPKGTILSIVHRMRRRLEDTGAGERAEG